jgi:hypothetical protein
MRLLRGLWWTLLISQFESGQQQVQQFAGVVLRMGWFYCGSNPQVG